jgi:predicted DNA-binding transcriptional regulator AlpA
MKPATSLSTNALSFALPGDRDDGVDALPHGLERFRVLSSRQTAALLGLSEATLERLPDGPPRVLLSPRRVGYPLQGVLDWLEGRTKSAREAAYP